jgi:N-acetylglutamate synthase-like GNAT family acetyltransferase
MQRGLLGSWEWVSHMAERDRRSDIEIRRARETDGDAIRAVLKTANFDGIGTAEMPEFPLSDCFVAVAGGNVVGVGGYRILDADTAKTTLLAVHPAWRGGGIGNLLQEARLAFMKAAGVKRIYTNTDDEAVIAWIERHYGFRRSGKLIPKVNPFGRSDRQHWVNMVWERPDSDE